MSTSGDTEFSVKVLAEELAYNKALKQFKMFITDRPLDPSYKVSLTWEKLIELNVCTLWISRLLSSMKGRWEEGM